MTAALIFIPIQKQNANTVEPCDGVLAYHKAHEYFIIISYDKLTSCHPGLIGVLDLDHIQIQTEEFPTKSSSKSESEKARPIHDSMSDSLFPFLLMYRLVFPGDQCQRTGCHAQMLIEGYTPFSFKTQGKGLGLRPTRMNNYCHSAVIHRLF